MFGRNQATINYNIVIESVAVTIDGFTVQPDPNYHPFIPHDTAIFANAAMLRVTNCTINADGCGIAVYGIGSGVIISGNRINAGEHGIFMSRYGTCGNITYNTITCTRNELEEPDELDLTCGMCPKLTHTSTLRIANNVIDGFLTGIRVDDWLPSLMRLQIKRANTFTQISDQWVEAHRIT